MPTELELLKNKSSLQMNTKVMAEWNYNVFCETRTRGVIRNKSGSTFKDFLPSTNSHISLTGQAAENPKDRPRRPELGLEKKFSIVSPGQNNSQPSQYMLRVDDVSKEAAYRFSFYARADRDLKFTLIFSQFNNDNDLNFSESKSFEVNSLDYTKHEFLYWPNADDTNKIRVYIHSEKAEEKIYFSNFSVVQTTLYEYNTQEIFKLNEVFEGWRPGEQKAHFSNDGQLSKVLFYTVNSNIVSDIPQMIAPVEDSGGRLYAPSYKRSSYYCDNMSAPDFSPRRGIFAIYDEALVINKLVFKTLNGRSYSKVSRVPGKPESGKIFFGNYIYEYEMFLLEKVNNDYVWNRYTSTAKFKNNGALILHWNGTSWTDTLPSSESQISSDGKSITQTKTIYGVSLNIVSIKLYLDDNPEGSNENAGTPINENLAETIKGKAKGVDLNVRFLEVSPRLLLNLTDYLQSFSISSETDSGEYFVPVGLASSNNATIVFDNLPRMLDNKTVPLFSDMQGLSALSNKLDRNIKFTITYTLSDGINSATDSAPLAVLFSDSWSADEDGSVKVEAFDYAKYLQTQRTTPFLYIRDVINLSRNDVSRSALIGRIISDWLIANNFTDFVISENISDVTVESFFSDPQYNIWEVLQELLLAYQITGYFDNNGILKFDNYLDPDGTKTSETPVFKFTDVPLDGYLPNIAEFSMDQREKPSSIKILYKTTAPKLSTDVGDNDIQKLAFVATRAPEILFEPEAYQGLGIATLAGNIRSTDKQIRLNTKNWTSGGRFIWPEYSGYAAIGSEIIKYDGVMHSYTLINNIVGLKKSSDSGASKIVIKTLHPHSLDVGDSVLIDDLQNPFQSLNTKKSVVSIQSEYEFTVNGQITQLGESYQSTIFGNLQSSQYKAIKNRSDLENLKANIAQRSQDFPLGFSIKITNTGILTNVERGLFGTRAQNHGVVDSDALLNDIPSNLKIRKYDNKTLSTIPNIRSVLSHYKNNEDDVFLKLEGKNPEKTILYFSDIDNQLYSHYKFSFTIQEDAKGAQKGAKDDVIGIVIGFRDTASGATNDPGDGLYIELVPETNKKNTTSIYTIKNGQVVNRQQSNYKLDIMNIKKPPKKKKGKDDKDGKNEGKDKKPPKPKLTWQKHQTVVVTFDKDGVVGVNVNGDRLKFGAAKKRDDQYKPQGLMRTGRGIGMYAGKDSTLLINSLAAYTINNFIVAPDMEITQNLDPILNNGKYGINPLPFYYSANPSIHGMAIMEMQFDKGPAFNIKIFKPSGSYKIKNRNDETRQELFKVTKASTVCSYPIQGAYMSKFLIINVSDAIIPFNSNENFSPLMVSGDILTQSGERFVQQDLPKNTGSEVLEIGSDWIQSESSAERILKRLVSQIDNSSITYELSVFGNPKIQIGDVVSLNYSQGNITDSSSKYYVISVEHDYDGALETNVRLRKITS